MEQLWEFAAELEGIEPRREKWNRIAAWAAKTKPFLRRHFQEIRKFGSQRVERTALLLDEFFNCRGFFFELGKEAADLWPIKTDVGRPRAELVSFEQRRHCRRNSREHRLRLVWWRCFRTGCFETLLLFFCFQRLPIGLVEVRPR